MVKRHGEFTSMAHFTPVDPCFTDSLNRQNKAKNGPKMAQNIQFSASNSAIFYRNCVKIKQYLNCSNFQHGGLVYSETYNYPFGRPSRKVLFTPCPQLVHIGFVLFCFVLFCSHQVFWPPYLTGPLKLKRLVWGGDPIPMPAGIGFFLRRGRGGS